MTSQVHECCELTSAELEGVWGASQTLAFSAFGYALRINTPPGGPGACSSGDIVLSKTNANGTESIVASQGYLVCK
jgi:hypothetical protein